MNAVLRSNAPSGMDCDQLYPKPMNRHVQKPQNVNLHQNEGLANRISHETKILDGALTYRPSTR